MRLFVSSLKNDSATVSVSGEVFLYMYIAVSVFGGVGFYVFVTVSVSGDVVFYVFVTVSVSGDGFSMSLLTSVHRDV